MAGSISDPWEAPRAAFREYAQDKLRHWQRELERILAEELRKRLSTP